MGTLSRDLRFGLRMMRRNPAITVIIVFTRALGIGVNSSIFSFVDAVLLRPLPVVHPEELVKVNAGQRERFNQFSSYPDYLDWQSQSKTMASLAAYGYRGASVAIDGAPILASVCAVSPNYFPLLGVKAFLGQAFGAETADPGHPLTTVVSYRFWQRRLGGDPSAAGRVVRLNKQVCTILGVMPRNFRGVSLEDTVELWIPMPVWTRISGEEQTDRGSRWLEERLQLAYQDKRLAAILVGCLSVLAAVMAMVGLYGLVSFSVRRRHQEIGIRMAMGAQPDRVLLMGCNKAWD